MFLDQRVADTLFVVWPLMLQGLSGRGDVVMG